VQCKGVGTLAIDEEVFGILNVAFHSHFHVLLGVSYIAFICLETRLVFYNRVATLAFIWAHLFVPAVAREVLEVLRDDSAVEFCVEVTLE
jgi:hypothetical protein